MKHLKYIIIFPLYTTLFSLLFISCDMIINKSDGNVLIEGGSAINQETSLMAAIEEENKDFPIDIRFIQNDRIIPVNEPINEITLNKEPFSIRYFCRRYNVDRKEFYVAQVAILLKDDNQATVGKKLEEITYFEPGTGLAASENGKYKTAFISHPNRGHHYLFYENENRTRVDLISVNKDNVLELNWNISSFYHEKNDNTTFEFDESNIVPISELNLNELFFIILIDKNLNKQIDEGELLKINVKFN